MTTVFINVKMLKTGVMRGGQNFVYEFFSCLIKSIII